MYQRGDGVTQDDAEAVHWFRKAADQGFDRAQYKLGLMYSYGQGVMADDSEAYAWLSLAAAQGNDKAKATLDTAKKSMTSRQIAKAQATAAAWKAAATQRQSREEIKGR
jgi:TPR repeat protein